MELLVLLWSFRVLGCAVAGYWTVCTQIAQILSLQFSMPRVLLLHISTWKLFSENYYMLSVRNTSFLAWTAQSQTWELLESRNWLLTLVPCGIDQDYCDARFEKCIKAFTHTFLQTSDGCHSKVMKVSWLCNLSLLWDLFKSQIFEINDGSLFQT